MEDRRPRPQCRVSGFSHGDEWASEVGSGDQRVREPEGDVWGGAAVHLLKNPSDREEASSETNHERCLG
jgi:hypothetical protein